MDVYEIILRALGTFVAGAGVACVGILFYFRQKQYEIVKERYLEGCIDVIVSELETELGILNHNWARCLHLLRAFRDEQETFDVEELEKGFLEYDASKFQSVAHHRLQNLTGASVFWKAFQLALSFVNTSDSVIRKEIPAAIRTKLKTDKIETSINEIVDHAHERLNEINQKSHRYALITYRLQLIADVLERKNMGFRSIGEFPKHPVVVSGIDAIEKEFGTEWEDAENEAHRARGSNA